MSDFLGWAVFILIWALAIGVWIFTSRRRGKLGEQLVELSRRRGWHFEPRPQQLVDCLIRGQDAGVDWEIRYATDVQGGEAGQSSATFRSEAVAFPGTLLAYPKTTQMQIDPHMGKVGELKGIAGTLFNWSMKLIGIDISDSSFHEVGTSAFLEKYLVLAPGAESARRLVGAVERELLNWPAARSRTSLPVVIVNPDGVTVRLVRDGTSLDYQVQIAERLVALGVEAVRGFR